jgi:lysine 2,3-aminomutase
MLNPATIRAMKTIRSIAELERIGIIRRLDSDLSDVERHFSTAVSGAMIQQIDLADPKDPVYRQFIPSADERNIAADDLHDPIGDATYSPVKGLVHRHADRCLLMPVNVCAVYCRFCFRRELIGPGAAAMTPDELEAAFSYIEQHTEIWEVILTGGDPLMMKPASLEKIIKRLSAIAHVKILRVHTRIPVVEPSRITDAMLAVLSVHRPTYLVLHANHAREFSDEAKTACERVIDAGVPMLSQSVLLRDVNDSLEALSDLMKLFVSLRIKPYYLHQMDKARGTKHFDVPIEKGQALMKALREAYSGLCQPTYVVDAQEGHTGKLPL